MRCIKASAHWALKRRMACAVMLAFVCLWSVLLLLVHSPRASFQHHGGRSSAQRLPPVAEPMSMQMREIRAAAAAAWKAYAATGMTGDDLRPLQGGTEDTMRVQATLFDSLGTLYVMGLHDEYEQAVAEVLRRGAPRTLIYQTSAFEYNIRIVGGTLSAAQLSGDKRLLAVAEEAAHTLLSSSYLLWPSPLPMGRVRMQPLTLTNFPLWLVARVMDASWFLYERVFHGQKKSKIARVGSYSLELRALTQATGNKRYACAADAIQSHILSNATHAWPVGPDFHRGATGVPALWDTLTGEGLTCADPSLGTGSDSFWEYLLKSHLQMPNDAPHLYVDLYRKLAQQLEHEVSTVAFEDNQFIFSYKGRLHVSHIAGKRLHEHLGCYIPGLLMLGASTLADRKGSSDMDTAKRLLDGCLWTYEDASVTSTGLGGEFMNLDDMSVDLPGNFQYLLRPETAESVFVAWRMTGDQRYRDAAWRIFTAILQLQVKGGGGFHGVEDVRLGFNRELGLGIVDQQPSYFIAETLKSVTRAWA